MRRMALTAMVLALSTAAFAGEWTSIDGFTLTTAEDVAIRADAPGSDTVGFALDAADAPQVMSWFGRGAGPIPQSDMEIIEALSIIRAISPHAGDQISSIDVGPYTTPTGVQGMWMTVNSEEGFHDAFVVSIETPGRTYRTIYFVAIRSDGEGRELVDRVLESLRITIEDAAG